MYDNPNISAAIGNITSGINLGLEELSTELRNQIEVSSIAYTDPVLTTDVSNMQFQITNVESTTSMFETRISELEKQMKFLIDMFKKFEEKDADGETSNSIPPEALETYNLKNELKFK